MLGVNCSKHAVLNSVAETKTDDWIQAIVEDGYVPETPETIGHDLQLGTTNYEPPTWVPTSLDFILGNKFAKKKND